MTTNIALGKVVAVRNVFEGVKCHTQKDLKEI